MNVNKFWQNASFPSEFISKVKGISRQQPIEVSLNILNTWIKGK